MTILADGCKITCNFCNDNQLPLPSQQLPLPRPPQLPAAPLPLKGKQLNILFYFKTIDGITELIIHSICFRVSQLLNIIQALVLTMPYKM